MSAHIFGRAAFGIAAAIVMLTGCGGGGASASSAPSLPVAAQYNVNLVNSVLSGSTSSGISFQVADATRNCIKFPQPFSDNDLGYNDSTTRTVQLVDCGSSGWFTVTFHPLDVSLADTTIKWTVSESGLSQSTVTQGGLCVTGIRGLLLKGTIIAKPRGGCPGSAADATSAQ